jgi:hypothetical protein
MEQPKYAPVLRNTAYLQENFNLMLTYSLSNQYEDTGITNLPMTYYPLNIVAMEAIMQPARPFKDKIGIAAGNGNALSILCYLFNVTFLICVCTIDRQRDGSSIRFKLQQCWGRRPVQIPETIYRSGSGGRLTNFVLSITFLLTLIYASFSI